VTALRVVSGEPPREGDPPEALLPVENKVVLTIFTLNHNAMSYSKTSRQNAIQLLSPEEAANPLQVIIDFYTVDHHISTARKCLHRWLRSAFAYKSRLNKIETLNTLYFQEQVAKLMEAAWLLSRKKNNSKAIITSFSDGQSLLNPTLFYDKHFKDYDDWDCVPRWLTRVECLNPYKAIHKCFRLMPINEWRELLHQLFHAASYNGSMYGEFGEEDDPYLWQCCLFKVLEACYLIKVREVQPEAAG